MSDEEDIDMNGEEEQEEEEQKNEDGEEEQKPEGEEEATIEQSDNAGNEEEEEERPPDLPINEDIMADSLQLLCKTGNGLSHAYVRLDAGQKEITDISLLKNYIHLRYIDLSNNNLKEIDSLNVLTHLLTLKLDFNKLTSAKLDSLPYLQHASFSNNKIKSIEGISHPKLEILNLNKNEITDLEGLDSDKLPNLQTLELRENKLTSTKGIKLITLKSLFIAANLITSLDDISELQSLSALHMRDNKLEKLDNITEEMASLQYLNLRGNLVGDYNEVKKMQVLPKLKAIVLLETPLAENSDYRLEVLIAVRRLERLDKDEYMEEERSEAEGLYEERRQKEQEEAAIEAGNTAPAAGDGEKLPGGGGENED